MPKKKTKHAKRMTTDEAVKHLFHPDIVKHATEHAETGKPMPVIEKKKPKSEK